MSMLSRKFFEKTAAILSSVEDEETKERLIMDFAAYFKQENPRFNITRFISACKNSKS